MENKKKLIGCIIGLACVILLVVLLMTKCGGGNVDVPETTGAPADVTENVQPSEDATVAPTEEVQEEIEPVEETEPEEVTEPVEETEPEMEDQANTENNSSSGGSSGGSSRPGGTGGYNGAGDADSGSGTEGEGEGSEGDSGSSGAAGLNLPEAGTEANRYVEILGQIPEVISTVKVPANQTICYNFFNAVGSTLTIEDENAYVVYNEETYYAQNGVVSVVINETDAAVPSAVQIGNDSGSEKAFDLNFAMPLGTLENPEPLESIEHILVYLPKDSTGTHYYSYKTVEQGILTLQFISMDPEDGECEIVLSKVQTDENGELVETVAKMSDSTDGTVSIDMDLGDEIIIQVSVVPTGVDAEVYIQGFIESTVGTEDNPAVLNIPSDTMLIPAGKTMYYMAMAAGATVEITGEDLSAISVVHNEETYTAEENMISFEAVASGRGSTCIFAVTNSGDTHVTCDVVFNYALGHEMNPADITIGTNTAVVEEGSIGYYFQWQAMQAGELTITMSSENANGWFYCVEKPDSGVYGDNHYFLDEEPVYSETITVAEDELVRVIVNTHSAEGIAPAGEVTFTAEFSVGNGTEENPYMIVGEELEDDLTIGAGETMYVQCRAMSMIFNLEGTDVEVAHDGAVHTAKDGLVTFNVTGGNLYEPPLFVITNLSDAEQTYHVSFAYEVGTAENPHEILFEEEEPNSIELEQDHTGYFFGMIAEEDGFLTITMDEELNEQGWSYCIYNVTQEVYGETHTSGDEEIVISETIEVAAGDEIQVVVGTFADGSIAPAGTVYFHAVFGDSAPVALTAEDNVEAAPKAVAAKAVAEEEVAEPVTEEAEEVAIEEVETAEAEVTEAEEPETAEVAEPETAEPVTEEVEEPEVSEPEVIEEPAEEEAPAEEIVEEEPAEEAAEPQAEEAEEA